MRKSQLLREGYVKGLKTAQRIISKVLKENSELDDYIEKLPLDNLTKHLLTPEKDSQGNVTGQLVPVDADTLREVIESLNEAGMTITTYTVRDLGRFLDAYRYYVDVYDYNEINGTDYEDDDELREEVDVIWVQDGNGMLV